MAEYIKISDLPLASDTAPGVELVGNNNGSTNRFPLSTLVDGTTIIADPTSGITLNPNNIIDKEELEEALQHKVDEDSYQEGLTVGNALQIISPDGVINEAPYIFRTTAGDTSISNGPAEIKSLKGNSVVKNQKCTDPDVRKTIGASQWSAVSYSAVDLLSGHEYLLIVSVEGNIGDKLFVSSSSGFAYMGYKNITSNKVLLMEKGTQSNVSSDSLYVMRYTESESTTDVDFVRYIDLTQWYNGQVPEGLTAEVFIAQYPWVLNMGYNAGEIINVHIEKLISTGFNQLDNGTAKVLGGNQYQITGSYTSIALEGEIFTPSADGLFTPAHNGILTVTGADNTTCVHLTWSGYRNGDYEPYQEHIVNLPISEIVDTDGQQLFSQGLRKAGNTADEMTNTKAVKKLGMLDLGSLNWSSANNTFIAYNVPSMANNASILCSEYVCEKGGGGAGMSGDKVMRSRTDYPHLYVKDSSIESNPGSTPIDSPVFKAAMQGQYLLYELADPIIIDFSEVSQSFGSRLNLTYTANDFGTEEFIVPVGQQSAAVNHETFYMTNLRDKIRNIDGNTEAGALMNPSVDNLLAVLGNVMNGTFSKSWDVINKCWQFSFVPNTSAQEMEGVANDYSKKSYRHS